MSTRPTAAVAGARAALRSGLRQAKDHADSRLRGRGWEPVSDVAAPTGMVGVVEEFTLTELHGWVTVPAGSSGVRITLHLEGVEIAGTWAVAPVDRSADLEIRGFRLMLADLWQFARRRHRITVRAGGVPLPIIGHGMHVRPDEDGPRALGTLAQKLAQGYVFSRAGVFQLSKKLDTDWQSRMLEFYDSMQSTVRSALGYDLFVMYGSLLGAVREGGFLGHDDDFDVAVLAPGRTASEACDELKTIAFALIEAGFDVEAKRSALHVYNTHNHDDLRLDVFHLYFGSDGVLKFPYGAAGTTNFRAEQWRGVLEVPFGVGRVLVPEDGEALAETIYGPNWRVPTPGFHWDRDRKVRAMEALLPGQIMEEIYWANFYAKTEYTNGSTFFETVNSEAAVPDHVIDIGCGDGRDSYAFGLAGRTVTGLDRSHVGVRHATKKAADLGMADRIRFAACDVSDEVALTEVFSSALGRAGNAPVLFYARFFLHSVPADVQESLMARVHSMARPGDMFAAEFRTTADQKLHKVHEKHYRRFQDGPAFGVALKEHYGFEVAFEIESAGLAPYQDEDPVLYRVIATRR